LKIVFGKAIKFIIDLIQKPKPHISHTIYINVHHFPPQNPKPPLPHLINPLRELNYSLPELDYSLPELNYSCFLKENPHKSI